LRLSIVETSFLKVPEKKQFFSWDVIGRGQAKILQFSDHSEEDVFKEESIGLEKVNPVPETIAVFFF
jgi:hypothetical protein